jgi:hypothetical protein
VRPPTVAGAGGETKREATRKIDIELCFIRPPARTATTAQTDPYYVDFSAQTGEFIPGDKYRILDLKPGPFDD